MTKQLELDIHSFQELWFFVKKKKKKTSCIFLSFYYLEYRLNFSVLFGMMKNILDSALLITIYDILDLSFLTVSKNRIFFSFLAFILRIVKF